MLINYKMIKKRVIVGETILILFAILLSINLVFAATSWCKDTDTTSKYKNGMNYYQGGVITGENNKGSWNQEDYCIGNKLYEGYCYYSNKQYYNGTAIFKCSNGCNFEVRACNKPSFITGRVIDSSTEVFLSAGFLVFIILLLVWFLFGRKNKILKKKVKGGRKK